MVVIDLTGKMLGQYRLEEQIARGGMGVIYRALQPQTGRSVAIKIISERYANNTQLVERFQKEVRISANLQHPHILPVYDVGMMGKQPYIVMAYMPGGTVFDRVVAHPEGMQLYEVTRLLNEVAGALDYIHRQDVLHRDLKPGNILLDDEGHAYLSDFGIALMRSLEDNAESVLPVGTYSYMAPEVGLKQGYTKASDIYSLGVVAFEMLTGQRPFNVKSLKDLTAVHASGELPDPRQFRPDLPPGSAIAIQQAMAYDPGGRPPLASALAISLDTAVKPASRKERRDQPSPVPSNGIKPKIAVENNPFIIRKRTVRADPGDGLPQTLLDDPVYFLELADEPPTEPMPLIEFDDDLDDVLGDPGTDPFVDPRMLDDEQTNPFPPPAFEDDLPDAEAELIAILRGNQTAQSEPELTPPPDDESELKIPPVDTEQDVQLSGLLKNLKREEPPKPEHTPPPDLAYQDQVLISDDAESEDRIADLLKRAEQDDEQLASEPAPESPLPLASPPPPDDRYVATNPPIHPLPSPVPYNQPVRPSKHSRVRRPANQGNATLVTLFVLMLVALLVVMFILVMLSLGSV